MRCPRAIFPLGLVVRLVLVLSLAGLAVGYTAPRAAAASPADTGPADPFTGASASFDAPPSYSKNYNLGDWGISEQRGTATYTFPIAVPPGRNGMAPDLALRYSSDSALRGGLAVGWRLDVPSVTRDGSRGHQATSAYQASLRSASGRLVQVPDLTSPGAQAYRVEFDDSFTRFFYRPSIASSWLAVSADGTKDYFGDTLSGGDHQNRWPITAQVDAYGNTIQYFWQRVTSGPFTDYLLQRIEYTSNNAAGLAAYGKVEFAYAPADLCAGSSMPIGAAPLSASPLSIEGSRRLLAITTSVRDQPGAGWRVARRVTSAISYGHQSCTFPLLPDQGRRLAQACAPRRSSAT